MAVTSEESARFREFLAGLSGSERAALLSSPATHGAPSYRRMIPELDRLSDADRVKVVRACRRGLKRVAEGAADAAALEEVSKVSAAAAAAMKGSAEDRRQSYAWAMRAAESYLQSDAYHAKRAAKGREVPDDEPAPPAPDPSKAK